MAYGIQEEIEKQKGGAADAKEAGRNENAILLDLILQASSLAYLAHQYLSQLDQNVRDALLGNVGTIVSFGSG